MVLGARLDPFLADLQTLSAPNLLGRFDHFEVTDLFALAPESKGPTSVLSVIVGEEGDPLVPWAPAWATLTPKLIDISGLKGWSFGVVRYALRPSQLRSALDTFKTTGVWAPSGKPLRLGPMQPLPPRFAPRDSHVEQAWNGILKNNYWNGSYLLELANVDKQAFVALLERPALLQDLSDQIRPVCPIQIARTSERLGNVLIQLPVTAVSARLQPARPAHVVTEVAWKPGVTPRPLRFTVERMFDGMIDTSASVGITTGSATISFPDGPGLLSGVLRDEASGHILWAQPPAAPLQQAKLNAHIILPDRRTFTLPGREGDEPIEIAVHDTMSSTLLARDEDRPTEWTNRRIYDEERARLARERRFVQYLPQTSGADPHETALLDLRALIVSHGQGGAWLWDPYLSATDILKTLFYSPHAMSDLRALTDRQTPPRPLAAPLKGWRRVRECIWPPPKPTRPSFAEIQREAFAAHAGNLEGLRLEYRGRLGQAGWSFHDRFLIFPQTDSGPLAWSLGTSVNMLGQKHHILQKVDDGRLVADAFEILWDALAGPAALIWKSP